MPRRKAITPSEPGVATAPVPVIHLTGVYLAEDLRKLVPTRRSTLRREIREGRLKPAKIGGRYVLTGEMILEWLRICAERTTELTRRRASIRAAAQLNHSGD